MTRTFFGYAAFSLTLAMFGCGASEEASGPAADDVSTGQATTATISKTDFKGSKAGCTFDVTWLQVTNLGETVRKAVNAELMPSNAVSELCPAPGTDIGGSASVVTNAAGILSVMYTFDQTVPNTAHSNFLLRTMNFDLLTGKRIKLGDIVDAKGRELVSSSCQTQWKSDDEACKGALAAEQITITKEGIRVQIDNQISHGALAELPDGGFLVPWSALKGHLTKGPASRLSGSN